MIVNEISLKRFLNYISSIYEIDSYFNGINRKKKNCKVKAPTVAKEMFASMLCSHKSIKECVDTNKTKSTRFTYLFSPRERIPGMHGLRECVMDTDYKQIEVINKHVIQKCKKNKIFEKNKIDGLRVCAWDGVELNETEKNIEGLPEREREIGIKKYIKYQMAMNVGERGNLFLGVKQLLEKEKITTKTGKKRAKTIGETKAFEEMWKSCEEEIGTIDVHVFDALYFNQNVTNLINDAEKYFVIRMTDESRNIYKDARGLFEKSEPTREYEVVEIISQIKTEYSKKAKHKDKTRTKIKKEIREISKRKLGEKVYLGTKISERKNSTVTTTTWERVVTRKKVWSDEFEMLGYKGKIRVIRSLETDYKDGKEVVQEIYVATNMLDHNEETVLKIIHLRWNIENNGFRTLKQKYKTTHIFIGQVNAINYMLQMMLLAFNLYELYTKFHVREEIKTTYEMLKKIFEGQFHHDSRIREIFCNSS